MVVPLVVVLPSVPAAGQTLPCEPVPALDRRLVLSGEAAVTLGSSDHESYKVP